jgi:hypothetical protein
LWYREKQNKTASRFSSKTRNLYIHALNTYVIGGAKGKLNLEKDEIIKASYKELSDSGIDWRKN